MCSSYMGLHMYGTCELTAYHTTLGKASSKLALWLETTQMLYLRAQRLCISTCGFALNLLGHLSHASSLLGIHSSLSSLQEQH